ncbi:MAG TPA: hypothetical protein VML55_10215, partial [Planctomycetaceae bacterium]|nr:hypothetical protein [Planctomycetaceae bacterium]
MATAFDSVLDRDLARRFVRLDWHLRRVRMIRGLGWLAVVLTFLLAGAFTFDLLVKPAAGLRVILLAGIGVAAAAVFVQTVVRPVLRKHTAAELAAVVEHAYPDLGERLTSAIELNDPSLPEEWKGSALMREMLTRQTMRSVAPLDFATAVSQSRATRASLCGMAALVLLISPAFVAPGGYRLLWSRLFNPWGNFDTPGNLSFEIEGGDRVVASGDDVTIRAHVRWRYSDAEPPRNVRLHWRDASGTTDSRQMERDADGTYATTLTNLFHPLEFHVAAGSDRSRTYQIHVVERPELLTAVLDVQPPAYTGLTAHKFDGVRGELAVFEGSRMKLHATFNKPVESADWRWLHRAAGAEAFGRPVAPAEGDPDAVDPAHMPLVLSSDRRSATLELTATEGGAFVFQLTDAHGLHNALEPDRVLVITPDAPPQIELGGSSQPRKARPDDVLRVDVRARDDVGLGALELHYEILRGGKDVFAVDPAHIRGRELDHAFELNLAGLELDSGSLLTYRIRAADNRPVPGPNETWSDPRVISIDPQAGPPESADVAERQQELRALLDEIRRDLDTNQAQVADLRKAAEDAGNDREFERNAEIPAVARAQRDLAGRVEDFAGRLAEHPLFANLTDDAEQVARETLDPAGQALEPAAAQPLAEKTESLQKNAGQLEQADDDLAEIAARFDDLARLEQELLELSRLARQAEQLAERALDLDRRRNERPPGETPAERAAREQQVERDREALAREHDSLMRQLDSLLERRPEILDAARQSELDRLAELSRQMRELIEPQDLLAEALRNEVRHAAGEIEPLAERQQELLRRAEELAERTDPRQTRMPVQPLDPELLRQALEALKAGNLAAAEERQLAAADELEQLAQ